MMSVSVLGGQEAEMPPSKVLLVLGSLIGPHPAMPSPVLVYPKDAPCSPQEGEMAAKPISRPTSNICV